jgi:hypothetical protein
VKTPMSWRKWLGILVLAMWLLVLTVLTFLVSFEIVIMLIGAVAGALLLLAIRTWRALQIRDRHDQVALAAIKKGQARASERAKTEGRSLRRDMRQATKATALLREAHGQQLRVLETLNSELVAINERQRGFIAVLDSMRGKLDPLSVQNPNGISIAPDAAVEMRPRQLASNPSEAPGTHSSRRINALLQGNRDVNYLEIGIEKGLTIEAVSATWKWGVDPNPRFLLNEQQPGVRLAVMESDVFFSSLSQGVAFDMVFVDGLHTFQQAYRDLMNALLQGSPDVIVLLDDTVPSDEWSAIPDMEASLAARSRRGFKGKPWHGDVYKVLLVLRDHHPELKYTTICGSGNEQTLVWRDEIGSTSLSVTEEALSAYQSVSYRDVFIHGIPAYFYPEQESEAINRINERRGT